MAKDKSHRARVEASNARRLEFRNKAIEELPIEELPIEELPIEELPIVNVLARITVGPDDTLTVGQDVNDGVQLKKNLDLMNKEGLKSRVVLGEELTVRVYKHDQHKSILQMHIDLANKILQEDYACVYSDQIEGLCVLEEMNQGSVKSQNLSKQILDTLSKFEKINDRKSLEYKNIRSIIKQSYKDLERFSAKAIAKGENESFQVDFEIYEKAEELLSKFSLECDMYHDYLKKDTNTKGVLTGKNGFVKIRVLTDNEDHFRINRSLTSKASNGIAYKDFKANCVKLLEDVKPHFEKHGFFRTWFYALLGQLVKVIPGLPLTKQVSIDLNRIQFAKSQKKFLGNAQAFFKDKVIDHGGKEMTPFFIKKKSDAFVDLPESSEIVVQPNSPAGKDESKNREEGISFKGRRPPEVSTRSPNGIIQDMKSSVVTSSTALTPSFV